MSVFQSLLGKEKNLFDILFFYCLFSFFGLFCSVFAQAFPKGFPKESRRGEGGRGHIDE